MEMTDSNIFLAWLTILSCGTVVVLLKLVQSRLVSGRKRPPGPAGWPIFGNMLDLGTTPHQTMYKLKAKYGPILWLRLGCINTLVIQSAKAAEELFRNHDHVFCDRKIPSAFTAHNYHKGSVSIARFGKKWRTIRRLWFIGLLSKKQVDESAPIRRKCVDRMIQLIKEDSKAALARGESGEVVIAHYLFIMTFNFIGNMILSRDLLNSSSDDGLEFYDAMVGVMEWGAKPNMADFFPFLKWMDPQRIKKNMYRELGRAIKVLDKFVKERIQEHKLVNSRENKDFLDVLLESEGNDDEDPEKISAQDLIIIILEVFIGGTGSSSISIEWAMTELLRHPDSMKKVKEELNRVVGTSKKVEESDIDQLPYLQAVVKETLRLHPVSTLLLPRNTLQDTNFMGYFIPKETQVFVNVWGLGKDPETWEDPLCFKPERFLGSEIDFKGQNYELIPLGAGRRMCAGVLLAHRLVHFGLATSLHCFDWELGSNLTPESIDMNERMGLQVRKFLPLKAIPKKKKVMGE